LRRIADILEALEADIFVHADRLAQKRNPAKWARSASVRAFAARLRDIN
jgi:hypothetical protein